MNIKEGGKDEVKDKLEEQMRSDSGRHDVDVCLQREMARYCHSILSKRLDLMYHSGFRVVLFCFVPGFELRSSYLPGRFCAAELHPGPLLSLILDVIFKKTGEKSESRGYCGTIGERWRLNNGRDQERRD